MLVVPVRRCKDLLHTFIRRYNVPEEHDVVNLSSKSIELVDIKNSLQAVKAMSRLEASVAFREPTWHIVKHLSHLYILFERRVTSMLPTVRITFSICSTFAIVVIGVLLYGAAIVARFGFAFRVVVAGIGRGCPGVYASILVVHCVYSHATIALASVVVVVDA